MNRILVTAPPMVTQLPSYESWAKELGLELHALKGEQTVPAEVLMGVLPRFDGLILGDDVCDKNVISVGVAGNLKAIVRWGAGRDNVDFDFCLEKGIPVANTPGTFGADVSEVAIGYMLSLAHNLFSIDRRVRSHEWHKPVGFSVVGKKVGIVGLGTIGREIAKQSLSLGMKVTGYDPNGFIGDHNLVNLAVWPQKIESLDFLILSCPLTEKTFHLINHESIGLMKSGIRIINVARGGLIDEEALIESLLQERVAGVALDVFETEPLPLASSFRSLDQCVLGSHNASNGLEAVDKTSKLALQLMHDFLEGTK